MASPPADPVFCGECPICQGGNRRIRCEQLDDGRLEFFALCDECEAVWLEPNATTEFYYSDAIDPVCPRSREPLYGPRSWWATGESIRETAWNVFLSDDGSAQSSSPPPPHDPSPEQGG